MLETGKEIQFLNLETMTPVCTRIERNTLPINWCVQLTALSTRFLPFCIKQAPFKGRGAKSDVLQMFFGLQLSSSLTTDSNGQMLSRVEGGREVKDCKTCHSLLAEGIKISAMEHTISRRCNCLFTPLKSIKWRWASLCQEAKARLN